MASEEAKSIVRARIACQLDSMGTLPLAFLCADNTLLYGSMGIKLIYKNTAINARLDEQNADEKIREVLEAFRLRGLPFAWWIDDESRPLDLVDRLIRHGFVKDPDDDSVPGMVFDLTRQPIPERTAPPEFEIRRCETMAEYLEYCDVCMRANDADVAYREQRALLGQLGLDDSRAAWQYVARLRGAPVASCTGFAAGQGVLGLYNINVVAEARRLGIGSLITLHVMRDAVAKRGCRLAVLEASTVGEKLYLSLGFETVARWRLYLKH
jgi:GNAT superfamily N-acetyltransferase